MTTVQLDNGGDEAAVDPTAVPAPESSAVPRAEVLAEVLRQHGLWLNTDGAEGRRARLAGTSLRGVSLWSADLRDADLCGADLRGANLDHARLTNASMRGALLAGTSLWSANIQGADLVGADLRGAKLDHVDATGADLSNAALQNASLWGAHLEGVDLRGSTGLTAAHIETASSDGQTRLPKHLEARVAAPLAFGQQGLNV
jgi:uncharacterized protein YjbI with pentapeptide repeats